LHFISLGWFTQFSPTQASPQTPVFHIHTHTQTERDTEMSRLGFVLLYCGN